MKTNFLQILALILLFISCSTEDKPDEVSEKPEEPEVVIEDNFNYLALRADGNLYEIGNKTGKVSRVGSISQMQGNLNMIPSAVTASAEKIFIYEQLFDPFQGRILVRDKATGLVSIFVLDFPAEIYGENAGLNSLDWDSKNGKLVGIVRDEFELNNNNTSRVVRIDPETMALEYGEISFNYSTTFSSSLLNNKLYALSSNTGSLDRSKLLEIDLITKTVSPLEVSGNNAIIGNLSNNGASNFLFGFTPVIGSTYMGEMQAFKLNLSTNEFENLPELSRFSAHHIARKSFYNEDSNEFAELILKENKDQILLYNDQTNKIEILELSGSSDFDTSTIIIDVREVD